MGMTGLGRLKDGMRLRGKVTVKVFDVKTMKLLQSLTVGNLVVNVGLQEALDLLFGLGGTAFG